MKEFLKNNQNFFYPIIIILVLVFGAALLRNELPDLPRQPSPPSYTEQVIKTQKDEHGVVCYIKSYNTLSCVKV